MMVWPPTGREAMLAAMQASCSLDEPVSQGRMAEGFSEGQFTR